MENKNDIYDRAWIIENAIDILTEYKYGELTLRGMHYRLVARGMFNTTRHYKRVVGAMGKARWDGDIAFEAFSDHDRETIGETRNEVTDVDSSVEQARDAINYWMNYYFKNRWENQPEYVEVWIEKKALIGAFQKICSDNDVLLFPCKGYPSLTLLNEAYKRLHEQIANGKEVTILYFGDYDASGENIPETIDDNLRKFGIDDFYIERILLTREKVFEFGLPAAPSKSGDSRTANWDGHGQVELDAVDIPILKGHLQDAIDAHFDYNLHEELMEQQINERAEYKLQLKEHVIKLSEDE